MVPIPAEYMPDFWSLLSTECPIVELTCLLPNGIIVLLKVNHNATLAEIKEDLWEEASRFPLYGKLHDISVYTFKIINSMAEEEELNDDLRKLCDIKPTGGVLIISECRGNSVDHSVNVAIGHLIGKGLQEFDALNSNEINDFRFKMRKMGDEISEKRNQGTWLDKLQYQFPPRLSQSDDVKFKGIKCICVETKCEYEIAEFERESLQSTFKLNVLPTTKPIELMEMILSKRANLNIKNESVTEYILKICGRDEYLVGDFSIIEFQYIQDCLLQDIIPSFLSVHINRILDNDYDYVDILEARKNKTVFNSTNTLRKKKNIESTWNISDNYTITLCTASKLNCDTKKSTEIGIQVGLFHGGKPLCQPVKTEERLVSEKCEVEFNVDLELDIEVWHIPRNAKLCFVIYESNKYFKGTKSRKPKEVKDSQINPIAWANTTVFDFKGYLRTGAMTLYLWTYAEDIMSDDVLHPLGTVVSNPNKEYCTALTLIFKSYGSDQNYTYPALETVINYGNSLQEINNSILETLTDETKESFLRLINDMDNFYDIYDQDRETIWSHRKFWIKHTPELFPKLLLCIDWNKREDVSQAIVLTRECPKLPIEKALELLDYAYADQVVRSFAVQCLQDMSDEDLLLYLLQLVQAIKHELYLDCDLVNFLIKRALDNQKIGHYLFWHLRSEMQVASVSVRFGLILEAYCRGSQEHIPVLQRQLKSIEKLKQCSEIVRNRRDKEKAKAALKEYIVNNSAKDIVRSPLDPSYRCNGIKIEKCRVMDSKMKPLWIVYENYDRYGEDVYLIFKNGDDLRQDMLTLQMLKIMDKLWKREGLDLRMNPYNCISLEPRVGMIQVVLNAETIANIQKEKNSFAPTASFRKGSILAWLKDHNTTEAALNKAIKEFTLSCAGYCVATYVLGIGDRHSDNIMVKKTGQLFHIDFGHILGHFKEKFGIKRERVPFVLTHDFVFVINKGQKTQQETPTEFKEFQDNCEKAFMILRKHGNLILSLFAMMISTGLPELSSEKDLQYLRETLVLSKTDEEAKAHFRAKFDEALSNSWKTSLNWASHNIAKNNKG
ncbi:phosphatidylinositol 4,5-bisphosphate 3-kinase catalytic subunit delta isoform-like isoform X2 [Sitophilus oryzae]|uniref:phosphatidylinositol 3-kinase n=1 Tax=Sitophilus oryzae TaxID=7048 RepID=A0A6J2YJE0_SITOR|nr:phosphatidylinositol 4,5-bisphosphate 3-kinase catalytic subunit delta isoform-like isoform X2 [Sitophilus oryzae]